MNAPFDSDNFTRQGVLIFECFIISGHFVMVVDIFLKSQQIDFDQNHSKCKT